MDNFLEGYEETGNASLSFEPCIFCQRTFNPETLPRHEKACETLAKKKRKAFDSKNQRLEGLEGAEGKAKISKQPRQAPPRPVKKSNWRQQHEEFIANIRAARGASVPDSSGKLPPPPAPAANPDYVQCPCCNRRFNQHSAERHIQFCKEQQNRIARKPATTGSAGNSLSKRTQYKPPLPGKKNSTGSSSATNSPSKTRNQFGDYSPSSTGSPTRTARALSGGKGGSSSAKMASTMATSSARRAMFPPDSTPQRSATESSIARRSPSPSPKPAQRQTLKTNPRTTGNGNHQNGYSNSRYQQQNSESEEEELEEFKPSIHKTGYGTHHQDNNREGSGTRRQDNSREGSGTRHQDNSREGSGTRRQDNSSREGSGQSDRSSSGGRHGRRQRTVRDPSPDDLDLDGGMWSTNPIADKARLAMASKRRGSGSSEESVPQQQGRVSCGKKVSKFCHMCGTQYPVQSAKFCCECGVKRLAIG